MGSKIKIVFHNDPKTYFYNKKNVKIIHSTLANLDAKNCFNYLKDIAKAIGLLTPEGDNILSQHYSRIDFIREDSILSSYLAATFNPISDAVPLAIFPFGFNSSQKAAVEKALTYSQSVIQGPPGTGKTQTILNILANVCASREITSAEKKLAGTASSPCCTLKKYTPLPAAPAIPACRIYFLGVSTRTAKPEIATNPPAITSNNSVTTDHLPAEIGSSTPCPRRLRWRQPPLSQRPPGLLPRRKYNLPGAYRVSRW